MALRWPFAVPFDGWIGLATAVGEVPPAAGYQRMPFELDYCADGVTLASLATVQFPEALADWGIITDALGFAAPDSEGALFTVPLVNPVMVARYARARIQAGEVQVQQGTVPVGYGRRAYGRGGYGVGQSASSQSTTYGLGGYGLYGYGTQPVLAGLAILTLTFDPVALCSAGTWAPAGCCAAERAAA